MIRHISIFTFSDAPANGKSKAENIAAMRVYLEKIPALYPAMKNQIIGTTLGGTPVLPDEAPLLFGDLVQIADYDTPEDAAAYAASEAHQGLVAFSDPMMKKVTAIDFAL